MTVGSSIDKIIEKEVAKTFDEGGIFDCTWEETEKIKRNQSCNCIDMSTYQIELVYNIEISFR